MENGTIYIIIGCYTDAWDEYVDEIVGGYYINYDEAVKQKQHLETVRATHPDCPSTRVEYRIESVEPCWKSWI